MAVGTIQNTLNSTNKADVLSYFLPQFLGKSDLIKVCFDHLFAFSG
jgi:hypothetical protein